MKRIVAALAIAALLGAWLPALMSAAENTGSGTTAATGLTGTSTSSATTGAATQTSTATGTATATSTGTATQEKPAAAWDNMRLYLKKRKRIEIDAEVAVTRGLVEVLVCTPRGKKHESLLAADVDAEALKTALLLLGLNDGYKVVTVRGMRTIDGERVIIKARWKDKKNVEHTVRIEDLIVNSHTQKTMRQQGWVFIGSQMLEHPETKQQMFAASIRGNLAVTWHDFDSILDTPLPEGADDTTFRANTKNLPGRGTKVTLIITPDEQHNKEWRKKLKKEKKKTSDSDRDRKEIEKLKQDTEKTQKERK